MTDKQLEDAIIDANHRYWTHGKTDISDQEFDRLVEDLRGRRPNSRCLDFLGYPNDTDRRTKPMLSMRKYYPKDEEKITRWICKSKVHHYHVEPKIDGIAVRLVYDGGKLICAETRGDGWIGKNILNHMIACWNIPMAIGKSHRVEVRGELYLETCRNKCTLTRSEVIAFINTKPRMCELGPVFLDKFDRLRRDIKLLKYDTLGPPCYNIDGMPAYHLKSPSSWPSAYNHYANMKKYKNIPMDGIVIYRGDGEKLAVKFPNESEYSFVTKIEYITGKTGKITPIAHVEPVNISGVTIKRINMSNQKKLDNLDIKVGSQVRIELGGGVIPVINSKSTSSL